MATRVNVTIDPMLIKKIIVDGLSFYRGTNRLIELAEHLAQLGTHHQGSYFERELVLELVPIHEANHVDSASVLESSQTHSHYGRWPSDC